MTSCHGLLNARATPQLTIDPLAVAPIAWGWATMFISRNPRSNFEDGYCYTPWIDIPRLADLIGARLHFEVLTVNLNQGVVGIVGISNSLEKGVVG